jgi:hypothetical protein
MHRRVKRNLYFLDPALPDATPATRITCLFSIWCMSDKSALLSSVARRTLAGLTRDGTRPVEIPTPSVSILLDAAETWRACAFFVLDRIEAGAVVAVAHYVSTWDLRRHGEHRIGPSRRLLRGRDKEERISVEDASQRDGGACAGDSFGAPWARALPLTTVFTSSGPKRNPTNAEPGWSARVTWHAPSSRRPRLLSLNHRMNFQFQNACPFGRMLGKSLRALRFNQMPALYRRRNVPAA